MRGRGSTGPSRRERWESAWRTRTGEEMHWALSEAPPQLAELVSRPDLPGGGALDLGCGDGVATAFLARRFRPSVGLDIAHAATLQAKSVARREGAACSFVIAEAPVLPFRDRSFGLVFDRGCLQAIPRQSWATYFSEVERVLRPGGLVQLLVSKPLRRLPKLLSARGIKARLRRRRVGREGGPSFLSPAVVRALAPPSFEEVAMDQFEYRTATGTTREFVHALFRRR